MMTEYREKIRQAEVNATRIVEQLNKLKDETLAFNTSTEVVNKVAIQLQKVTTTLQNLAMAQKDYVTRLKEIDLSTIVQRIADLSKKVKTLTNIIIIGFGATLLINLLILLIILNK